MLLIYILKERKMETVEVFFPQNFSTLGFPLPRRKKTISNAAQRGECMKWSM
jgi:hypothetical protein